MLLSCDPANSLILRRHGAGSLPVFIVGDAAVVSGYDGKAQLLQNLLEAAAQLRTAADNSVDRSEGELH